MYNFLLKKLYNYFFHKKNFQVDNSIWSGDYQDWTCAEQETSTYDDKNILEKCKSSLLQVKNGYAVYERDSVLFNKIEYSLGLLVGLLKTAVEEDSKLSVLDFGGSLGTTYYQNKSLLKNNIVRWSIVEQSSFVDCGKKIFQDDILKFYYTIDDCLLYEKPNVLILSSVLQYMKDPYEWIHDFNNYGFKMIIIDRTSMLSGRDVLTIQKVPENIYKASYPCWFLDEKKIRNGFSNYEELISFDSFVTL